ncbi:hypothetical protein F5Y12DRAFT_129338 [Xylaria sp. FL1777]|nr:hypothetical protein F5Y12DRAFT_129338 [Xylaria sp. FL1777]
MNQYDFSFFPAKPLLGRHCLQRQRAVSNPHLRHENPNITTSRSSDKVSRTREGQSGGLCCEGKEPGGIDTGDVLALLPTLHYTTLETIHYTAYITYLPFPSCSARYCKCTEDLGLGRGRVALCVLARAPRVTFARWTWTDVVSWMGWVGIGLDGVGGMNGPL